jgi:CheY-like chemotaxis protein
MTARKALNPKMENRYKRFKYKSHKKSLYQPHRHFFKNSTANKLMLVDRFIKKIIISVLKRIFLTGTRIFFVEDDEIVADVIGWRLNKLGYNICGSAKNGVDAISLIKEKKPDLVLLDIELKGSMDGIELGELLSSQTKIPFIYLTAHTEDNILKRAKNTGSKG